MMVSPNPSANEITISITDEYYSKSLFESQNTKDYNISYSILNRNGVVVLTGNLYSKTETINISNWQKGIYYIVYTIDGEKKSISFIKN